MSVSELLLFQSLCRWSLTWSCILEVVWGLFHQRHWCEGKNWERSALSVWLHIFLCHGSCRNVFAKSTLSAKGQRWTISVCFLCMSGIFPTSFKVLSPNEVVGWVKRAHFLPSWSLSTGGETRAAAKAASLGQQSPLVAIAAGRWFSPVCKIVS